MMNYYVVSDGTAKPYRVHMRNPGFATLQALEVMCKGRLLADVVAVIGSIDIVLGEIDRYESSDASMDHASEPNFGPPGHRCFALTPRPTDLTAGIMQSLRSAQMRLRCGSRADGFASRTRRFEDSEGHRSTFSMRRRWNG